MGSPDVRSEGGNLLVRRNGATPSCRPVTEVKITPDQIRAFKSGGRKVAALTAYDYPMARMLDEAGVPFLLVGDSLGMVVLGYPDTTHVTMDEMEHHVRAVVRARPRALIAADLPYRSYENPTSARENARRLAAAGAEAVKAEGGLEILSQVEAIVADGIPFVGHLGMLPQHVLEEGGYKIKGRDALQRAALLESAQALEAAGAFAIVLELVTPVVAAEISAAIRIPTIGIGSGLQCDGQILVTPDLVGTFPWFTPGFVRRRADGAALIREAVQGWMSTIHG